jgi:hypothetical protein
MTGEDCSDSSTATSNGYSGSPAMDTAGFAGSMEVSSAVYPIATESHGDSEEDSGGEVGWRPTDTIKRGSAMDEEKIFVTVRIRPLNSKEICSSDELAWECPDNKTVVCLYNRPDRHFPQSYTFGKPSSLHCQLSFLLPHKPWLGSTDSNQVLQVFAYMNQILNVNNIEISSGFE